MRKRLAATATAVVLGVFGLSAGAAPAHAFRTHADMCAYYFNSYWHWGEQYVLEVDQFGYETPFAVWAWTQVVHFGNADHVQQLLMTGIGREVVGGPNVAVGPYSQGVRAGDFLYVSGQPGIDPATGEVAGPSVADQAPAVDARPRGGPARRREPRRSSSLSTTVLAR